MSTELTPLARDYLAKARFPKRLRERDVAAPGLGIDAATLTAWSNKLRLVQQEVGKQGVTVALLGIRGTGKSQMAVELGRQLCLAERTVLFVRAAWLFVQVRSTYQAASQQTEAEAIAEYVKPRLLIIDEVDKRKDSAAEDMLLENIVCQRHDDGKDTILISNRQKKAFEESVGPSIVSRMNEGGGVWVCDWASFRTGN